MPLLTAKEVFQTDVRYINKEEIGRVAVKLARKNFFGESVLVQCIFPRNLFWRICPSTVYVSMVCIIIIELFDVLNPSSQSSISRTENTRPLNPSVLNPSVLQQLKVAASSWIYLQPSWTMCVDSISRVLHGLQKT